MSDQPAAKPACEHYWASHCYSGLSVRLCQLCHEPDWEDFRGQLAEAERKGELAEWERRVTAADAELVYRYGAPDFMPAGDPLRKLGLRSEIHPIAAIANRDYWQVP